jgi:ComF family protein
VRRTSSGNVGAGSPAGKPQARRRTSAAERLADGAATLIWPRRSLLTGRELAGPGIIEAERWVDLRFITGAVCRCCGLPFEIETDPDQACGACLADPPAFDRARAALEYGDLTRDLVLALKRQGRRDGLATFGRWMALAGAELLSDADLVTPVPLHYWRLVRRGYNQSVWLAAAVARASTARLAVDVLARTRSTPSQAGLSADGRRRNVQGAFRVRKSRLALIEGRRVVLIDDVLTTGATAEACARALKRGGASKVDVLTLARVAAPRRAPI